MPPFPLDGGVPLVLARGLAVAGLFAVFGVTLGRVAVLPPVLARLDAAAAQPLLRGWRRLVGGGLAVAVAGLVGWAWLVAGTLADRPGFAGAAATLPELLGQTRFGHALLAQVAALAGVGLLRRRPWLGLACATLALGLQVTHGHGFAMAPGVTPLAVSELLHLLAGGAWLGGLPSLLLIVAMAPMAAAPACRRFSVLGSVCVPVLAVTAFWQGWMLIGGIAALLGTGYGLMAVLKLGLFLGLLGLAAWHRWWMTPALVCEAAVSEAAAPGDSRIARRFARSIALEAVLGLAVVLAAAALASLPPGMEGIHAGMQR
jgi:putative copper export protein